MKGKLPKLLILIVVILGTGVNVFYVMQCKKAIDDLPILPPLRKTASVHGEAKADAHGGGHGEAKADAHGGGHGEAKADAHGGGHGEAKADAHGGGHGEAKADAHGGGHGEAKADAHGGGHGEAKADAHGGGHGGDRAPASAGPGLALFSVDELYVNVASEVGAHTLGLKLEVELFDEKNRGLLDSRQSGIRSKIIESAREQDYFKLNSLAGKLYFKEILVGRLNEYFGLPVVKSIHFSLFYLQ